MAFPPPPPQTLAFARQKTRLRQLSLARSAGLWRALVQGPDDTTATTWIQTWAPIRTVGPAMIVAMTDAYVDAIVVAGGGRPFGGDTDVDEVLARIRPGTSDVDVAMRPIKTVRKELAEGASLAQALDRGRRRLNSLVATDLQQTMRHAFSARTAREPSITSYRRVLTGPENCALCVIASTQRYRTDRLMPIHPGCDCTFTPLLLGQDNGQVIDRERLDEIETILSGENVRQGDRVALANTKLRINVTSIDDVTEVPHGELGPLLAVSRHRNTELQPWQRRTRREFNDVGAQIR